MSLEMIHKLLSHLAGAREWTWTHLSTQGKLCLRPDFVLKEVEDVLQ